MKFSLFFLCVNMGVGMPQVSVKKDKRELAVFIDNVGSFQHQDNKDGDKDQEHVAAYLDGRGVLEASSITESSSHDTTSSSSESLVKKMMVNQRSKHGPGDFRK